MPLTAEQIAQMDAALGGQHAAPKLDAATIAKMDAALGGSDKPQTYELSDVASSLYNKAKDTLVGVANHPVQSMNNFSRAADQVAYDIVTNPVDAVRSAASGITRTIPQGIDLAGAVVAKGGNTLMHKAGLAKNVPFSDYANMAPLDNAVTSVVGQEYQPQTSGGQAVKTIAGLASPLEAANGARALMKSAKAVNSAAEAGVNSIKSVGAVDKIAANELASQGFEVNRLNASGGDTGRNYVRGYLRNTFVGGKMVEGAGKRAAIQSAQAANKALAAIGQGVDAAGAGEKIINGLDAAKRSFGGEVEKLYAQADALMPQGFIKLPNLRAMVGATDDKLSGLKWQSVVRSKDIQQLADDTMAAIKDASAQGRTNVQTMKAVRSNIGKLLDDAPFNSPEQRYWKRAYGALSKDLEGAAQGGADGAVQAIKKANEYYRQGRSELEKQFARYGGRKEVEDAFKAVASPDALRNAPQRVEQLFNRLPSANRKVVGATLVRRLGQKVDGGEFDPMTFATKWAAVAPRAKNAIANGSENAAEIDKLVRNIKRVAPSIESIPQTGQVAAGRGSDVAAGLGVFVAPWASAAKFSLDGGLGWLLTKPQNIKILNKALETQNPKILMTAVQGMEKMGGEAVPQLQALGQSLREQFSKAGDAVGEQLPITRKPSKPVSLNARPETTIAALGLTSGAVGLGNFASSLAVPNQGPAQENTSGFVADKLAQVQKPTTPKPAASIQGPDPIETYLDRKMMVESSGKANAKAKTSSATGLFQYTTARWLEIAPKALGERANSLSKRDLLMLRNDPKASRQVADYDTRQELAPSLERAGVPVTSTTLYLAHFLGSTGARKLLTAKIGTPVHQVIGAKEIKANPFLKGKKAEDVLRWAQKKMRDA
jgi:hypothetical protein